MCEDACNVKECGFDMGDCDGINNKCDQSRRGTSQTLWPTFALDALFCAARKFDVETEEREMYAVVRS